jgi:hypothetical protein
VLERSTAELDPAVPAVRRQLQDLGHYAETLARGLSDDSPVGTTAMNLGFPFGQVDPTTLIQALQCLKLATKVGLKDLNDLPATAGHPDRSKALDPLIYAWHGIYRQAGGRGRGCYKDIDSRTYRGRFLDLLDEALAQAATVLTTKDPREPPLRVSQPRQQEARERLRKIRKMIHISRVTLAKRIEKVLKKHPS